MCAERRQKLIFFADIVKILPKDGHGYDDQRQHLMQELCDAAALNWG